jgi:hypothetical protein
VGTGKTCTAYGLIERCFRQPPDTYTWSPAYFAGGQVADFLDSISPGRLKDQYRGSLEDDPLARAMRASLTLLDDLGTSKISEWREEQIFPRDGREIPRRVAHHRYLEHRPCAPVRGGR